MARAARAWLESPACHHAQARENAYNRIHLVAHASDGSVFKAYIDSGGGANIVGQAAAERLKLAPAGVSDAFGDTSSLVAFPAWLASAGVPAPPADDPLTPK